jgi:hypothetical protein
MQIHYRNKVEASFIMIFTDIGHYPVYFNLICVFFARKLPGFVDAHFGEVYRANMPSLLRKPDSIPSLSRPKV